MVNVYAYGDCDEVEFFLNGRFMGKAATERLIASITIPGNRERWRPSPSGTEKRRRGTGWKLPKDRKKSCF